ncbi:MAG TPA: MarR family transcriptional regulator [Ignavibacteria bacterium]|jgi:DNA-binding MarR family transcriptional regulator
MDKSQFCKCLYYSTNALSRNLNKIAEEEFSVTGLAPTYGFILMTVNKNPGIPAGEIANIMQLDPSTVTRLVDKLDSGKYVKRTREGKFVFVYPTSKSIKLNNKIIASWKSLYKRYTDLIGIEKSRKLTGKVYEAVLSMNK